ncbi:GAF domain-containing protein [Chitinimonas sp.]|uniref:GAF domain-containing protein n=1 Tax=Chitinimonas sp. TaxID=1934313 RepID=UPI0035AEDFCE
MQAPALPADEPARLAALREFLLLDTPDEAAFDRATRLAQALFDVPIALVSLVDENRQWFKSCIGLPVRETGRDISFCGHAILGDATFVIGNALDDARFADNPLVTGPPHIRFYAGFPLKHPKGYNLGTLCIIDRRPRQLSTAQIGLLEDIGHVVEEAMYTRQLHHSQRQLLEELDYARRETQLDKVLRIWNRSAMTRHVELELEHCRQTDGRLCVATLLLKPYQQLLAQYDADEVNELLASLVGMLRRGLPQTAVLGRLDDDVLAVCWSGLAGEAAERQAGPLFRQLCAVSLRLPSRNEAAQVDLTLTLISLDAASYRESFSFADFLSAIDECTAGTRNLPAGSVECMHFV